MPDQIVYNDSRVKIIELLGSGDTERIESMLALYRRLFPMYAHYTKRMQRRVFLPTDARSGHIAHYWLVEVESKPAGMVTFRYIQKRKCGLGIAFGVDPSARTILVGDIRLSKFVISMIMEQLTIDSKVFSESEHWGLVTEVEHRELMEHYKRMGMYELPIKYVEPIFPSENGQHPNKVLKPTSYEPVILGITPNPKIPFHEYDCKTLNDFALAFLVDHYGLPPDHKVVQSVLSSIQDC